MAEDTIQQIVQSNPASAINAHPSLVQRRPQERRRGREQGRDEEQEAKPDGREEMLKDSVTLSKNGRSASAGTKVATHIERDRDNERPTIDIRI